VGCPNVGKKEGGETRGPLSTRGAERRSDNRF